MKAHVMMVMAMVVCGAMATATAHAATGIEDFANVSDWAITGGPNGDIVNSSVATDSVDKKVGTSSGKFVYAHTGINPYDYVDFVKYFSSPLDVRHKAIAFWFKSQPDNHGEGLSFHVISTNGGYFWHDISPSVRDGKWHHLVLPINGAFGEVNGANGAPDASSIGYVRFRSSYYGATAYQHTFHVDQLELVSVPAPATMSMSLAGFGVLGMMLVWRRRRINL